MKINKRFNELVTFAASEATLALSELLKEQMTLEIVDISILKEDGGKAIKKSMKSELEQLFPKTKDAIIMTTPLIGNVDGVGAFLLPTDSAYRLCDILLNKKQGSTKQLGKLEQSALLEVGNIVIGCFLNSLGYVSLLNNILHKKLTLTHASTHKFPELNYQNLADDSLLRAFFHVKHVNGAEGMEHLDGLCDFYFDTSKIMAQLP